MIIFKSLTIGILIFAWVLGYKYLAWDDHRVLGRNLLYSTIRTIILVCSVLTYMWITENGFMASLGTILIGCSIGFMFVFVYALCSISSEKDL